MVKLILVCSLLAGLAFGSGGGALPGGAGSVTSVGMSVAPSSLFAISGSPVTTTGTFAWSMKNQGSNCVVSSPSNGTTGAPLCRSLVTADLPSAATLTAFLNPFVASGVGHLKGLVPDPGVSSGSTRFLREDATWAVPATSGVVDGWGFHVVGVASDQDYYIQYAVPFAGTINSLWFNADSGTATINLTINGTPVTGCSSISGVASDTLDTCTAANTFVASDTITLTVSASSSWTNFRGTIKYTR